MSSDKGQSTVEYILLVTAVILVIVWFTTSKGQGSFQNSFNQVLNQSTQDMLNVATRLQDNAAN